MGGFEEKFVQTLPHLVDEPAQQQLPLPLGFQSSPQNLTPNLDPQSPRDDPNQQSVVNEECQYQSRIVDGEFQHQSGIVNEELQKLRSLEEEFRNLVLEKTDEARNGVVEDVNGGERDSDRGEENGGVEGDGETGNGDDDRNEDERGDGDGYRSEKEDDNEGYENVGEDSLEIGSSMDLQHRSFHYPLRPDAEDCSYYMRTGNCKFGSSCKFNHPLRKRNQAAKENVKEKEDNPEKTGQTECKYFTSSGGCKFGNTCRYNHTKGRTTVAPILEFNFLGLPIRVGEKECPYYMRTGSCKYGSNCRFNHPDPTATGGNSTGYGNGRSVKVGGASQSSMSPWSSPRTLTETGPFVPMMFSPTYGVPSPSKDWNGYQAPVYTVAEGTLPTPPAFARNNIAAETNFYTHQRPQMVVEEFPVRPGQPECSYFMKTGDCKYRSGCRFHHPKNQMPKAPPCTLSDKGLPLRPDQNICTHYNRYGICKFGPACKFDHPVNFAYSASSGASGPPPAFGNSVMGGGARVAGRESLLQQPV